MGPTLERYEVLRLLGRGGMAVVYLARHQEFGTLHAVKVLSGRVARLASRLRTEGELQRSLRHDNVLQVTDVVEADGAPALVLEYVAGPTLADLLGAGPRLSVDEIDALGQGILAGVAAAHGRKWVHRDLKPANILLAIEENALVPKVADFGLAKVLQDDGTAEAGSTTRLGLGTRRYMSYEQLSGFAAEPQMDVFSLGAILFELVERTAAFPTLTAWDEAIRRGVVPPLTRRDVPDRFARTIAAALSERANRPGDAGELLERWSSEATLTSSFRPETLRGAAWCGAHLTQEQLADGRLTAADEEHLSACVRCRVGRLQWEHDATAVVEEVAEGVAVLRFERDGDVVERTFDDPVEAVLQAVDLQRKGPGKGAVQVGVPAEAEPVAARLARLARPGQTLTTREGVAAVRGYGQLAWTAHGHWRWADRLAALEVFEVGAADDAPLVPPVEGSEAWRIVLRDGAWVPERPVRRELPVETDRFVGRDADLERLAARVAGGERLIVLHGAAGIGKTRLAVRYAWTWLGGWPGGAWFCNLADARDLDGLIGAVARALDVPLGKDDPVMQLGHAIAGRGRCLVVLDNFEQVAELASGTVGKWAARAAEAVFMVTSRVVLGLGEGLDQLEPLDEERGVELFVERATAVRRDLDWQRELKAVRGLVAMLDGLPLAIELCAARVRTLLPSQIAVRMGERFKVLAGGEGRPDRQETLRQAIDWSYELLKPWQQEAFGQVSVFEGGFTMEAAEAVLDLSAFPEAPWAVDAVHALLERALLRRVGAMRFGMLVSVQVYAMGTLENAVAAEERHGRYFAQFGEHVAEAIHVDSGARRALSADQENLVVACRRAVKRGDGQVAALTLQAAMQVLFLRGPLAAGVELATDVAGVAGLPPVARGMVAGLLGEALRIVGRGTEARSHYDAALVAAREVGDRRSEGIALGRMGILDRNQGRPEAALAHFDAALSIHREVGNRRYEGIILGNLGSLHAEHGRPGEARVHFVAALEVHREVGNRALEARVLGNLGNLDAVQGRLEDGLAHLAASVSIAREVGDRQSEGVLLGNLGNLHQSKGRPDDARAHYDAALTAARYVGDLWAEGEVLGKLAHLDAAVGRLEEARVHYDAALSVARLVGDRRVEGHVLANLGLFHAVHGSPDEASRCYGAALGAMKEVGNSLGEGVVLGQLGDLSQAQHRADEADEYYRSSELLLRAFGDVYRLAIVLCGRARLERSRGKTDAARVILAEADVLALRVRAGPDSELSRIVAEARRMVEAV